MAIICPTVTVAQENKTEYDTYLRTLATFAKRIHIDLADGVFAPTKLTPIDQLWWPKDVMIDLHVMYATVIPYLESIIALKPNLVIVHAESAGNFHDIATMLHDHNIKVGVALLEGTSVDTIAPAIEHIDHVLIFGGKLGFQGGHARMKLLGRVTKLRKLKKNLEIGWDGGIDHDNISKFVMGGIDVLNVGGAVHSAANPHAAYAKLEAQVSKSS